MKQIDGFQTLFVLTFLAFIQGSYEEDVVLPVMVFDEGETGLIPCIKEANDNDFFWSRGIKYDNSKNIAYIARGISSKSNKYDVYMDGTLVIRRISLTDEGNYFCRILSDTTESYIGITIDVRASPEVLDISIEGCTSGSNCVKVLEPSSEFQFVCTAYMISESMTLKWYNGEKEIMGDVYVPETGRNGTISNVITFTFGEDSTLSCKAEGANIEENTAVIQLKRKEEFVSIENKDTSIFLVLTIVLGITCLILLGLLISLALCYRKLKRKQRKTKDKKNMETGMVSPEAMKQVHQAEKVLNTDSKETKDTRFSKNENEPSHSEKDLKEEKNEEELPLMNKSDTSSSMKDKELQKLQKEITKKNDVLKMKEEELKSLQTELKETKEALRKKTKELITTANDLKKREDELKAMPAKALDKKQQTADADVRLQKELKGTKENFTAAENAKESLQKELKSTKEKLTAAENAKENFHKELQDTKKKLTTAENANKISKEELQDIKRKLTTANSSLKDKQNQLTQANEKLGASEKTKEEIQTQLTKANEKLSASEKEREITKRQLTQANGKIMASEKEKEVMKSQLAQANEKLSASEKEKESLEKGMQAVREKLLTSEKDNKQIISNIVQIKDNVIHNLPQTRPIAIIGVKGELPKIASQLGEIMPKPKYSNVLLVSGPSIQSEIAASITDKLNKTCYNGTDTYMFLFGRVECELHNTLHGENYNKGLIERVAHLVFYLSKQMKEKGLQVNMYVSTGSTSGEGRTLRLSGQSSPSNQFDKLKIRNGVEITLNKYYVQSQKNLVEIASHMTPNKGYTRNHGLLKLTVETLVNGIMVSKGSITIVAITNLTTISEVFKGRRDNNFEEVLSLLTRNSRGGLIFIPIVDPALENEPRKTFKALKEILDEYR